MSKQFQTTGLKGVLNTIGFFSSIQEEDVFDISTKIEDTKDQNISAIRTMLISRTTKLMMLGQDQSPSEFLNIISRRGGNISSQKEINDVKKMFIPEHNTGTNKIGEGYRKIANMVMLTMRAESNINTRQDLMPYQFIEIMLNNSANKVETEN
jgi:hypothetical protein